MLEVETRTRRLLLLLRGQWWVRLTLVWDGDKAWLDEGRR